MRVMEENRLESGVSCEQVCASLHEHIAYLQAQIETTRRQIKDHPPSGHPIKIRPSKASATCC